MLDLDTPINKKIVDSTNLQNNGIKVDTTMRLCLLVCLFAMINTYGYQNYNKNPP